MHTYIIVLELDKMKVNAPYESKLHCTIVHWFESGLTQDELLSVIEPILKSSTPFVITSGEIELFGDNNDLPMHLIDKTSELEGLHKRLIVALEKRGVIYLRPQYILEGWRPHVTNQDGKEFKSGSQQTVRAAYLIESEGTVEKGPFNVLARVEIGNESTS